MRSLTKIIITILALVLAAALVGGYYWYTTHHTAPSSKAVTYKTPEEESNVYVRFDMEGYDSIVANYWQTPTDADMSGLFQQSVQKAVALTGYPSASTTVATSTRAGTVAMLASVFSAATTSAAKSTLAAGILQVALYNLPPSGRDELLSQTQQVALRQEVSNVNPSKNLYDNLGVSAGASVATVEAAYTQQKAVLAASSSPVARAQLAQATYAHQVLSNTQTKARYDTAQVEPTIFSTILGKTLYLYISKMSPTTLAEFQDALANASSTPGLNSMIIDLRGNIGGSLADAASLLGYFEGTNQYAFDLFSQGTYNVIRTTANVDPLLTRYDDVAVLTDGMTQSTAEVLTASLKRFHLAHVVGATTRGWGTVENTFPMTSTPDASTTYALLLVHAITLRDDQQPVQGRGVDPDVTISNANWKSELSKYFRSASLIAVLKNEATQPPIQ